MDEEVGERKRRDIVTQRRGLLWGNKFALWAADGGATRGIQFQWAASAPLEPRCLHRNYAAAAPEMRDRGVFAGSVGSARQPQCEHRNAPSIQHPQLQTPMRVVWAFVIHRIICYSLHHYHYHYATCLIWGNSNCVFLVSEILKFEMYNFGFKNVIITFPIKTGIYYK